MKLIITASATVLALGIFIAPLQVNAESKQVLILAANQSHHGIGTVTRIDYKGKQIELDHGPIKSIGWMSMKMFFAVDDAELLDEVEVGDKVDFDFIETRDKRHVITDIEAQ